MKRWEIFEQDALNYIDWLVRQDPDELESTDAVNLQFLVETLNGFDTSLSHISLVLAGGSDSTISDIAIEPAGIYVESKMKSAQCGQMVVEQDAYGHFQLATSIVGEIAPWDIGDTDIDGEEIDEGREDFDYESQWYFQDVKDHFLDCMNAAIQNEPDDFAPYDGEPADPWNALKFMYNHPATYELIFAHYDNKDAHFFITKSQSSTYSDDRGWLIFPIDYLENYFNVWATYRHKKSGSRKVPDINIEDAEYALGISGQVYKDEKYGWCVNLPAEDGIDDRHTAPGNNGWYKLLAKEESDHGNICFQIRQLGSSAQPTVVLNLKVKPQSELPSWHR